MPIDVCLIRRRMEIAKEEHVYHAFQRYGEYWTDDPEIIEMCREAGLVETVDCDGSSTFTLPKRVK